MNKKKLTFALLLVFYSKTSLADGFWECFCKVIKQGGEIVTDGIVGTCKVVGAIAEVTEKIEKALPKTDHVVKAAAVAEQAVNTGMMEQLTAVSANIDAQKIETLQEIGKQLSLGQEVILKVSEANNLSNSQTAASLAQSADKIGKSAETVGKAIETLSNTLVVLGAAVSLVVIVKGGYDFSCYMWPSEEEKDHVERERLDNKKAIAIMKSEKKFFKCLSRRVAEKKDDQGIPYACKDSALMYATAAGYEAFNRQKKAYKEATA